MSTETQRSRRSFLDLFIGEKECLHIPAAHYGEAYVEDIDICFSCIVDGKHSISDICEKIAAQQGEEE